MATVVGFEQSSQHFSSKTSRINLKKTTIHFCALATNGLSNSNNKD